MRQLTAAIAATTLLLAGPSLGQPVPGPGTATPLPDPARVDILQLADGIYSLQGGEDNAIAIEQASGVILVDMPQDEAHSRAVIAKVRSLVPGKPIRFVINPAAGGTTGPGHQAYVAAGATLVGHVVRAPATPGAAAKPGPGPRPRLFADKLRPVELVAVADEAGTAGFSIVYLPAQKFLIEPDAFRLPPEGVRRPAKYGPGPAMLYRAIVGRNIEVRLLVPMRGRLAHLSDLQAATGNDVLKQGPRGCQQEAFYC